MLSPSLSSKKADILQIGKSNNPSAVFPTQEKNNKKTKAPGKENRR